MGKRSVKDQVPAVVFPAPPDLRAAELDVGGDTFLVLSHALPAPPALPSELTAAEAEVVRLVLRGYSNEEIAAARRTAARTVANQLALIYRKLGVGSRGELASFLATSS